jgi:hypothetical protein
MKTVAEVIGVSRSNLADRLQEREWPIREADISLCANRYRIGARCLSLNSGGRMDRNRG